MYPSVSQNYPQKPPPIPPSPPSAPPQSNYQPPLLPQYATGVTAAHYVAPNTVNVNWSSSLCACCSDVPNCCLTCWCPCITFGQIAEIVDKGKTRMDDIDINHIEENDQLGMDNSDTLEENQSATQACGVHGALYAIIEALTCCGCMYSCVYRTKMRSEYGLRESPCNDCLVHLCCERCALCQEYRELKHRGFDISIGWQGNIERQNGIHMPPMAHGGMYR